MIAIEVEGGAFTRGRHTRGAGFIGDMEKYNAATSMGWRVFRVTPSQFGGSDMIDCVKCLEKNDKLKRRNDADPEGETKTTTKGDAVRRSRRGEDNVGGGGS